MKRLLELAERERERLLAFVQRLVQTPSLSGQEGAVAELIEGEMRALDYDEVRRDQAGNVVGRLRGEGGGRCVMLNGHMDHVDAGLLCLWEHPPYEGVARDGRLHGRGSADMKGPLAAQVYSAGLLRLAGLRPAGDVVVAAVVQEETGGLGTQHLLDSGLMPDVAIVGEPSNLQLMRGHRGRLEILVTVEGRSVHASAPERGANPHYSLAAFVRALRALELPRDADFGGASVAPTLCSGDQASSNVIPGRLVLHLDYRNLPQEEPGDVVERLQAVLDGGLVDGCTGRVEVEQRPMVAYTGLERTLPNVFPAFVIRRDHPLLERARAALAGLTGACPEVGLWRFSTDGGRLARAGIPTIGYGPGEEHLVHTTQESIAVADLVRAAAGYAALCLALSQPDTGS